MLPLVKHSYPKTAFAVGSLIFWIDGHLQPEWRLSPRKSSSYDRTLLHYRSVLLVPFDTPHDKAFSALKALPPGMHWSSFDVSMDQARNQQANILVTSIWNFHSYVDERERRIPTVLAICQDEMSGTYWYRVERPPVGTSSKNWVAHWNRIRLALEGSIPIVGVLKDVVSRNCSLENVFDCPVAKEEWTGLALWLQLVPRGEIGTRVRIIDIAALTTDALNHQGDSFERALSEAINRSPEERLRRLSDAPKLPKSIIVITRAFVRNPDVIAQALHRANGTCEGCKQTAPFMRQSDGSPYLEVHHRLPLSAGGEDTLENAVALCPNCHRRAHYG